MKTTNTIKNFAMRFVAIMAVVLLAGNAWGADYTITFVESSNNSDGSTARTSKSDIISSSASDYVASVSSCTKVFNGKSGYGIKLGSSDTKGTVTMSIASSYQKKPTKITFNAARYGSDNTNLAYKINGGTEQTITLSSGTTLDDYEVDMDGETTLTSITISGSIAKRLYVKSIKVTYSSGYAVTYNNGGHGTAPTGGTVSSVTLAAITGVTGYTCTGWTADVDVKEGNTTKTAGTALSNGTTYTILSATTFTAQWRANDYKVVFKANNGTEEDDVEQNFKYGTAQNLTANGFTVPAHKYFLGWNTSSTATTATYTDEQSVNNLSSTDGATVTLHAIWKDHTYKNYRTVCNDKYTVTYEAPDATSGEVPTDATEYSKNDEVTVLGGGTLAKTNYSFAGWTDGANNYEAGDKFNITDFVTLSAVWECAKSVNVSKASTTANGSFTLDKSGELATCEGNVVVTVTPSANTGYEFSAITVDGVGTKDDNAKTVTYTQFSEGESEINVIFAAKHITVTWDVNGGDALEDETGEYIYNGSTVSLPTPTRTGYTFDGWFTETSGGIKITEIGTDNKPSDNVTYHAHWTKNKYKVYFRNNGVAIDDAAYAAKEVYYGDAIGTLPAYDANKFASCDGTSTVFKGWSEATIVVKQPDAPTFASSATVMGAKDMYLNAVFATETSGTPIEHAGPSFSRSEKQNTITSGYTLTNYSDADDNGFYKDKTPNGGTCYLGIYKSNTAIFSSTPASITATVKVGGGLGNHDLTDPVLVQLLDNSGQPIGTAATVTEHITTATGDTYSDISIPTTGITSAYGLRVSHIKENNYNVRYYSFSLKYYTATVSYTDYVTACCTLTGVENVTAEDNTSNTQVTLNWDELSDEQQAVVSKLQVVDADDVTDVIVDDLAASATSATITGLTRCETYSYRVAVVGNVCTTYSDAIDVRPIGDAMTVTFDNDYEGGAVTSETTTCDETSIALATPDSREGYRFMGWFNGDVEVTADPYTPTATVTLKAHWEKEYTLHYEYNGATGAPEDQVYIAGEEIALPENPTKNFLTPFEGWDYSVAVTMVDETHFEMPASDLTVTAVFGGTQGQWLLVKDESTLSAGDIIVITSNEYNAIAGGITSGYMQKVTASFSDNLSILNTPSNSASILRLGGNATDGWTFANMQNDDKLLGCTSTGNVAFGSNAQTVVETWNISIDEYGDATIATTDGTKGSLQYNSGNPRFTTYTSTQKASQLYRFSEGVFYDVNMPSPAPEGGKVKTNTSMAKEGDVVTLTYTPSRGYTVNTLTVTGATSGSIAISPAVEAGVTKYTFTMPAEAVTVAASFEAVPAVDYNLVTNADNLAAGMKFLLVAANSTNYFANAVWSSSYFTSAGINTPAESKISITTEAVEEIILEGESGAWKLMQGGSQRINKTWAITISAGIATIENGNDVIKFNHNGGNTPRFKDYSSTFEGPKPALYALPYTTYNFVLSGCKTIKVATGYTYTYTIKNTDVPSVVPEHYEFLNKWTDGTYTYAVGDAVVVSNAMTLQPCWKVTPTEYEIDIDGLPEGVTEIVVTDGKNLNVNDEKTLDNLTVEAGGEVSGESTLTVNNLTINSEAGKSGQVMNENVTVNGDIYLEIKLDKSGTMDPHKYYCISAPFDVAALEWGNGTPMEFNVDYQLFIYDGDKRARTGNGWQRVGGTMEKNSAYFIGFDDENANNQNIIRLKAANKTIPTATSIELEAHDATYGQDATEIAKNSNWNGLGNPRLNYVNLNKNVSVYEAEEERFDTYVAAEDNGFVVGTAFFVQGSGYLTFDNDAHGAYRAPKRESEHYMYCVEIAQENASRYDNRLYVMASETASTSFEEGKDLPTLNSETSKYGALIWTKNYGMRLVIEETPMVNNKASYELGIFAPANGTYRIETPTENESADLYLTYNGRAIWNLSMGTYEAELTKGQNEGYGLLLVRKAPSTATDIDNVQGDNVQCTKVIIDDHVYILRGGQMYDVTGKAVK